MYVWAIYISPRLVCIYLAASKQADRSRKYINRSQIHESGNWETKLLILFRKQRGHAVSYLGINRIQTYIGISPALPLQLSHKANPIYVPRNETANIGRRFLTNAYQLMWDCPFIQIPSKRLQTAHPVQKVGFMYLRKYFLLVIIEDILLPLITYLKSAYINSVLYYDFLLFI